MGAQRFHLWPLKAIGWRRKTVLPWRNAVLLSACTALTVKQSNVIILSRNQERHSALSLSRLCGVIRVWCRHYVLSPFYDLIFLFTRICCGVDGLKTRSVRLKIVHTSPFFFDVMFRHRVSWRFKAEWSDLKTLTVDTESAWLSSIMYQNQA